MKCREREIVTRREKKKIVRAAHAQHELRRMRSKKEQPIILEGNAVVGWRTLRGLTERVG